ncbi:hypothetical protein [Sulfurospirillum cavolei]|uniref:hypothetical protein n=1 Tax=Sulfurospirillum cavolei TaxID=366522 RepID=UPI003FA24611
MYRILLACSIFLATFGTNVSACGGSCLECHPKLQPYIDDSNHFVLKECITCHNKPSEKGQCGKDCFDCHSRENVYAQKDVGAHQELKLCGSCHEEKVDFTVPKRSPMSTQDNLIRLFK